jgi:hypothetical protein
MNSLTTAMPDETSAPDPETDFRALFHRLNNQLGIILAHAELLEAKAGDEAHRARAAQIITSVIDAMGTARTIRQRIDDR